MRFKLAQGKFPAGQLLLVKIPSIKWCFSRVSRLPNVFSKDQKYIITGKDFRTLLSINVVKIDHFLGSILTETDGLAPKILLSEEVPVLVFSLGKKKKKRIITTKNANSLSQGKIQNTLMRLRCLRLGSRAQLVGRRGQRKRERHFRNPLCCEQPYPKHACKYFQSQ